MVKSIKQKNWSEALVEFAIYSHSEHRLGRKEIVETVFSRADAKPFYGMADFLRK